MNTSSVTTRQSIISWVILLGLVLLVAVVVLMPWWSWMQDYELTKAKSLNRLHDYNDLIKDRGALETQLQDQSANLRLKEDYLSPTTVALAAVELQQKIKSIVANGNGKLLSTQILPVSENEPATKIAVKVRMQGDSSSLLIVLHALESDRPPLFVENLSVRQFQRRRTKLQGMLDIRFDLSGYMRKVEG